MSPTDKNKATVRKWLDFMNGVTTDSPDDLFDPAYVYHGPGFELRGPSDVKRYVNDLRTAFADVTATVDRMIAEGDFVVTQSRVTAIQRADFMGIPSHGATLDMPCVVISRLVNGRIAEDWEFYDNAELKRQLESVVVA